MIHKFTALIELSWDDENGEYPPPSPEQIEHKLDLILDTPLQREGFDKEYDIEVAKGTPAEAFGIEEIE